ncbi:ATP-binding protein [Streptomyces sp. NPDC001939]
MEQEKRRTHEMHQADAHQLEQSRRDVHNEWRAKQLIVGEVQHWVERRLPALLHEIDGAVVRPEPALLYGEFEGTELAGYLADAEVLVRERVTGAQDSAREAARTGVRVAAEEIQAALMRAQHDIDTALDDAEDHSSPSGYGISKTQVLTKIDHSVTLAVHMAQRLRVLTHSWPGVQRATCSIAEIVESARGRIMRLDAVSYVFQPETADVLVEGLLVEPAVIALAELLDNAASHSGGTVTVAAQRLPSGMRITVVDEGLGMSPLQLEEAERSLNGPAGAEVLAEPFKLGLLVVARLAADYGLRAELLPSASGGVRAHLLIPADHLLPGEATPHARHSETGAGDMALANVAALPVTASSDLPGEVAGSASAGDEMAPATPPGGTADGVPVLPRRTPRKPIPAARPVQPEIDHDAFTDGFAQVGQILAEGLTTDHDG